MRTLFSILIVLLANRFVAAETSRPIEIRGEFETAISGDVFLIRTSAGVERIRLIGIDAPEREQPYAYRSQEALSRTLEGKTLHLEAYEIDGWPFPHAWVWPSGAAKSPEASVNHSQIQNGWAWYDRDHIVSDSLAKAEAKARSEKLGLWGDDDFVPPWVFKRRVSSDRIVSSILTHFDMLEKVTTWILLATILTTWSAFSRRDGVELLGLHVEPSQASAVVFTLYACANAYVVLLVWRIGDLLHLLSSSGFNEAFWAIGVHSWVFNPFAIGRTLLISKSGAGLLILLWWMSTASVALLDHEANPASKRLSAHLRWLFPLIGIMQCSAFGRIYRIMISHRAMTSVAPKGTTFEYIAWTSGMAGVAAIGGYFVFRSVLRIHGNAMMRCEDERDRPSRT